MIVISSAPFGFCIVRERRRSEKSLARCIALFPALKPVFGQIATELARYKHSYLETMNHLLMKDEILQSTFSYVLGII